MIRKLYVKETVNFDIKDELQHDIYNAIAKVMFKYRDKGISKNDFDDVMNFVAVKFFDGEDFDFEMDENLVEDVSRDDVRELVLYIINKEDLYPQIKSVIKNMKRKRKANKYDDELAIKAWQYVADAGVKMYDKEYGSGRGSLTFLDKPTRKEIAVELRDYFDEDLFEEE